MRTRPVPSMPMIRWATSASWDAAGSSVRAFDEEGRLVGEAVRYQHRTGPIWKSYLDGAIRPLGEHASLEDAKAAVEAAVEAATDR